LIIRDIPSVIPVIDNLLHQLDRKSQQVEIEARVVAASRSFAQDIGTQLGFGSSATSGRSISAVTLRLGQANLILRPRTFQVSEPAGCGRRN